MIELTTAVVTAIREAATAYYKWLEGKDKRMMDAAIDAAESYIRTNENVLLPEKEKEKLLLHYSKRFFQTLVIFPKSFRIV